MGQVEGAAAAPDLRAFTQAFFTHFGATVTPLDARKQGPLQVEIAGDLAAHFGGTRLGLAFQTVEPGTGHQLVAHGSRAFDRMVSYIDARAALTVRRLPVRSSGSETLMRAVRPLNAGVAGLKLAEQEEPIYLFHWRLTYRADDKREELYSVVLDGDGALLAPGSVGSSLPAVEVLLADSEAAPVALSALGGADSEGVDEEGEQGDGSQQRPGRRLPPMTQLVRMAERARRIAIYHADLRCVAHEAEILPRLYKAVDRLTNYYSQQMEELPAGNGERLEALQADLERKVAEEVENHRLRVFVDLSAYAILFRPTAGATLALSDGRSEATVRVWLDRYTGHLHLPACHACGTAVAEAVLCRNGHVACDGCSSQCAICHDMLCAACGVEPCGTCGREICDRCGRTCWACGNRACNEHLGRCPTCGDEVCDACRTACAECGSLQCHSHLRADAVVLAEDGGAARLICATCAVRCPGCRQYSARMGTCSLSGQRFCASCLAMCSDCGRTVGPGFFARDPEGKAWCRDCARVCGQCGNLAEEAIACASCGAECCSHCVLTCHTCGRFFCSDHAGAAVGCGHVLCVAHGDVCAIGGEVVCPTCSSPCAICDQPYCGHHQALCAWCGKHYCSGCVDGDSEVCATCRRAALEGDIVFLQDEPCASDGSIRLIAPLFSWQKAENRALTVYFGHNYLVNLLVVVREGKGGRLAVLSRRVDGHTLALVRKAK